MWKLGPLFSLFWLLLLLFPEDLASAQGGSKWQTLGGNAPVVIARGGFSGLFPDSSMYAYKVAPVFSLPDVHIWCDVQLTKDGVGICFPDIRLDNASDIGKVYTDRSKTYTINGISVGGLFSVDFTFNDLGRVNLTQRNYARPPNFDVIPNQILRVENVVRQVNPPNLWLNVPYDAFFSQHNLSMQNYISSVTRNVTANYISSPEVRFLRSIVSRFRKSQTKLVFQFLGFDDVEPSTNQTYQTLLNNLTIIKTFASGIIVPKYYIWPVDENQYLRNYTSLVVDAHKTGLSVFASGFANDAFLPHDYSFDPVAEYLSFIDNGVFSVDGVLSDFPITPSATIDCYSHMTKNDTLQVNLTVISSEGASGDYPGCTDMAYNKAVADGVDILDCPVQITNDGIPFCLGSINLIDRTNAAQSQFSSWTIDNPDLNIQKGIFTYNLTWTQIQSLRPAIANPYTNMSLYRNPNARNVGNLMQLSDFLEFANNASSVSGVLIGIENAAYLAEKQGLDITDAVSSTLSKVGYNNQKTKKIMIKSSHSAVLSKFKNSNYELVYQVNEHVSEILNSTILEIKTFASSVIVSKASVFPTNAAFVYNKTLVVPMLQFFNLSVYVQLFGNEFGSQPWDFFADAYVEINTHVRSMGINGVITDFPATAAKYRRNRCLGYKQKPPYMSPVLPGGLIQLIQENSLPPVVPNPVLKDNDVAEPPLPPVSKIPPNTGNHTTPLAPRNGQPTLIASTIPRSFPVLLAALVLFLS